MVLLVKYSQYKDYLENSPGKYLKTVIFCFPGDIGGDTVGQNREIFHISDGILWMLHLIGPQKFG